MLSVSIAKSPEDFEAASALCKELAEWDMAMVQAYGVDPDIVMDLYHGETATSLAARYLRDGAGLFLATWAGSPAGCLAFSPFDDLSDELHRFFVAPALRRRGIGRALMQSVMADIGFRRRRRLLAHTTIYMTDAVALYRAFGLELCPPFRDVPESVRHTEVFLSRRFDAPDRASREAG
ncbi:Acetyltransferase (GNAT) family protein [Rhizobium sp. NFR07]|uniref:GNAT family N-acetyltransferase n=1 Tax=Rhizobium sp. NFR07 TaxID=1566262 RepID=UPI0008DFA29B|nr:GNAT family N-acetyltransferase [Rhizobium sp. NFR07]SFB05213.1 Acetyltransferase (GNAT) family protein [Rhizobium sp. NFR07]